MGFRDDEVYAALTRAREGLEDVTAAVVDAEAAMMQPDPAARPGRTLEDHGGCSGELRAHREPPIYRARPGESDVWRTHTTDPSDLPVNDVCEIWDPATEEWQPFSAWTEHFHREGLKP